MKLAIFDMDGTCVNTLDDITKSVNFALESHDLPARTFEEIRQIVGNGVKNLIETACPENTSKDVIEQVLSTYLEYYAVHCNDNARPYDGILEMFDALHNNNIIYAIVSNKEDSEVQQIASKLFGESCDFVLGQREEIPRKPAPDMVQFVMKSLGATKDDTIYIGDSEVDIKTAANAELPCVCVSWGYRSIEKLKGAGASTIVNNTDELLCAIL